MLGQIGTWRILADLALIGMFGIAAAWVLLAIWRDSMLSAFAFVVAIDLVLMVRLARLPRGTARGAIAAGGTLLAIVIANGWLMAARVGLLLGMMPWEGISLMGPGCSQRPSLAREPSGISPFA